VLKNLIECEEKEQIALRKVRCFASCAWPFETALKVAQADSDFRQSFVQLQSLQFLLLHQLPQWKNWNRSEAKKC